MGVNDVILPAYAMAPRPWAVVAALVVALLPGGEGMCPPRCSCNSAAARVSCSASGLSHVPHFMDPYTQTLDLSGNTIAKLESTFSNYEELVRVNLSSNNLHSLGRNQFSRLTQLTVLDLSGNRLSKIRQGAFAGLHSLVTLDLRHNKLERLGPEVFTGLVGLETLDLSYNSISEVDPEAFLHLRSLSYLCLAKNSLTMVGPDWPAPLSSLVTLDLSQNLIKRTSLNSLTLSELDLSDNMLSSLPPTSLSLPGLTSLNLAYNKLVLPPSPSLPLPSLHTLSLSGNMIRHLGPSTFAHLPSLSSLQLAALPRLESVAPLALRELHNLSSLSLASCRHLHPLPVDLFSTTPRLSSLDLSHLRWTSLPSSLLPGSLTSLRVEGLPLTCDCSLLWLWDLQQQHRLQLLGAQCDGTPLDQLQVDGLACNQGDYLLLIAGLGGVMALLILAAIVGAVVKCYLSRRPLHSSAGTKLQCDYLQYTTVPPPPGSPPAKPYYSSTVGHSGLGGGGLDGEGLYYTLQPVYSSSSGSASSDPACTSSSYSSPVQYSQYAHQPPGQPQPALQAPHPPQAFSQHGSPLHLLHTMADPYEGPGGGHGGTQKKRTLVKYRYPDVLPSDNANQNYYV